MKIKKISTVLLSLTLISSLVIPVSASAKSTVGTPTGIIWNETTGETITYDPAVGIKSPTPILDKTAESTNSTIRPMGLFMYNLDHYDQDSAVVNWTQKYVGATRVDNSGNNYTSADLIFTATNSDTTTATATASGETQAELNLIVTKVDATVTIGGSYSRSWMEGYTYGTKSSVPPNQIGTVTAYIPGTSSLGSAVYKVTNTSDSTYFYENRARGATVPAKNMWNLIVQIPSL